MQAALATNPAAMQKLHRFKMLLWQSLTRRGILGIILTAILMSFYVLLFWSTDIDQLWVAAREKEVLAPLERKIQAATGLAAEQGLKDQKTYILSSYRDRAAFGDDYHRYLLPENRVFVDRLRRIDTAPVTRWVDRASSVLNPISQALRNRESDRWFLYGSLYTLLVVVMGIRFYRRWRNDRYQKIRTLSVMAVQVLIAFLLPAMLLYFNTKEFYFSYFWPLKLEYFLPSTFTDYPRAMALWAVTMSFVAVPVLTYFFGKRWYCSWVCGCGALANTMGDPFRQLSDKSELAWRIERITVYSVLAVVVVLTALIFINEFRGINDGFAEWVFSLKRWYGFFISAGFAGVIGTGFYPLMGTRVWCRFGCPQAAILGILQVVFSRFRISTNGGQCIACGSCSANCEMGIDVRSYAMRGEDIKRASCVGCGLCMSVCPRGVLKLENKSLTA
jgi:NAD-dependent dihydropyrimidine dehydrogenase PreA subunit